MVQPSGSRSNSMSARARQVRAQLRAGTYLLDIDTLAALMAVGLDTMAAPRRTCRTARRRPRDPK